MYKYKVYTLENGLIETNNIVHISGLTWHREDGPAFTKYYKNGNIEHEVYYVKDKKHRIDGPAYIEYYDNGKVSYEEYWYNNKKHRLDGPSDIGYDTYGNITNEVYCINDIEYSKENYHKELLKLKIYSL